MNPDETNETPLESWKEIAAYLQRNEVTARRWEKGEGLPIHRHTHQRGSSVYAFRSEIDAWRASRKIVPEPPPPLPLWKSLLAPPRSLAVGVTLALCLVMVGNGIRPQVASAQGSGPVARQVLPPFAGRDQVSADGRYIPFGYDWEKRTLGIHDLVTGTDRIVPTGGDVPEFTVLSRDNSKAAYQHFPATASTYQLGILDLQGTNQRGRNLLRGNPPGGYIEPVGWSADNKEVLVIQTAADRIWQIAMVSVAEGTTRVLKSLKWGRPDARISPDGRYIAYNAPIEGQQKSDIFILSTDGSRETPLIQHPADDSGMIWTPDGSKILFLTDRTATPSLWAIGVRDGRATGPAEQVRADFSSRMLGMSPAGTLYYNLSGRVEQNIYRAEVDSNGRVTKAPVIATDGFVNENNGATLSPDGASIAYFSAQGQQIKVVVKSLTTGEERVVPSPESLKINNGINLSPRWFADGRSVLVLETGRNDRPGIVAYRIDVASGRATEILHLQQNLGAFLLVPSTKGNFLYHPSEDGLMRRDLETGRSTMVLPRGASSIAVGSIAISPDGNQLAFVGETRGGETHFRYIRIIPATGGEPREIHRVSCGGEACGPDRFNTLAWTPDQKHLLFVLQEGQPFSIWKIPAAGGTAEKIGITTELRIRAPFLLPDGKSLYFTGARVHNEVWAMENFMPKAAGAK